MNEPYQFLEDNIDLHHQCRFLKLVIPIDDDGWRRRYNIIKIAHNNYIQGISISQAEIANILGVKPSTISKDIGKLRRLMENWSYKMYQEFIKSLPIPHQELIDRVCRRGEPLEKAMLEMNIDKGLKVRSEIQYAFKEGILQQ